ncbi:TPA: hypothetical protein DCR49_10785 [Candidatus Delongbacteria bacterium]|nr:MAG: hypothetical protein A2Y39_03125 [Candidatus Delongbacteria bacterium GWF2_40_14]HAQ62464.1 hypothetical protein [Candidatus Delongbacteria bacterium]
MSIRKKENHVNNSKPEEIGEYISALSNSACLDFEKILLDKLSDRLDENQKINKIKNTLQKLKSAGSIRLESGKLWVLSK